MALGRREFERHEGPQFVGPCYAVRAVEKRRSQWAVVDRCYNASTYAWHGVEYPADTLQTTAVLSRHKTKTLALGAA